eukprot:1708939-Amphidinium_carterae.1
MSQSESPELSAKRKWISEQSTEPTPGARSKAKAKVHVDRALDWLVVDVNDTPGFWPARMKKTLMTDGVGGFQCKICKSCYSNLPALIDHYTSRHFNMETHVAMQKRVFNIASQLTPKELSSALEIVKKHGMRLTPTWDFAAYRADVMRNRGSHYRAQSASSHCQKGQHVETVRE